MTTKAADDDDDYQKATSSSGEKAKSQQKHASIGRPKTVYPPGYKPPTINEEQSQASYHQSGPRSPMVEKNVRPLAAAVPDYEQNNYYHDYNNDYANYHRDEPVVEHSSSSFYNTSSAEEEDSEDVESSSAGGGRSVGKEQMVMSALEEAF